MTPQFSLDDLRTPEGLERVLRQFQNALGPQVPATMSSIPVNLSALADELAPIVRNQLQAGGIAPLNLQSLLPGDITQLVIEATHAQRITLYPPNNQPLGTLLHETDRDLVYEVIADTNTGVKTWVYFFGIWRVTHVNRPGGNVSAATNATPIVITTTTAHNLITGDRATVFAATGNTAANGQWLVTVTSPTTFELNGSVGNGAYTGLGQCCGFNVLDTGLLLYETDRFATYRVMTLSNALRYVLQPQWSFIDQVSQANLPTDLDTKGDTSAFYRVYVVDYGHNLHWAGGWDWDFGELGSGYYGFFESAPTSVGWQICDGSTVNRLNASGTVTSVTVPNVTTPRYIKGALASAAVAGYSGNTPTGSVSAPVFTGTPAASVDVQSGSGESVVDAPYTPAGTNSAPTFTGNAMTTLELPNKQTIMYYRQ